MSITDYQSKLLAHEVTLARRLNSSSQQQTMNSKCFEICSCSCGAEGEQFDQTLAAETNFAITMRDLAYSNMGWFIGFRDPCFDSWRMSNRQGVYLLWDKDEFYQIHGLFHSKALYVGKGSVKARIWAHSKTKRFLEDEITCFTFVFMENRKAKYIEQLILDLYDVPLNKAGNSGKELLCSCIDQEDADFGS